MASIPALQSQHATPYEPYMLHHSRPRCQKISLPKTTSSPLCIRELDEEIRASKVALPQPFEPAPAAKRMGLTTYATSTSCKKTDEQPQKSTPSSGTEVNKLEVKREARDAAVLQGSAEADGASVGG